MWVRYLKTSPHAVCTQVCVHYNKGIGLFGACTFMECCTKVHICQHFVQDDCLFGPKCKRLHSIDEHSRRMLEERGLGGDIIHDLPYIYQNVYRLNSQTISNGKGTYIRLHILNIQSFIIHTYSYTFQNWYLNKPSNQLLRWRRMKSVSTS